MTRRRVWDLGFQGVGFRLEEFYDLGFRAGHWSALVHPHIGKRCIRLENLGFRDGGSGFGVRGQGFVSRSKALVFGVGERPMAKG